MYDQTFNVEMKNRNYRAIYGFRSPVKVIDDVLAARRPHIDFQSLY